MLFQVFTVLMCLRYENHEKAPSFVKHFLFKICLNWKSEESLPFWIKCTIKPFFVLVWHQEFNLCDGHRVSESKWVMQVMQLGCWGCMLLAPPVGFRIPTPVKVLTYLETLTLIPFSSFFISYYLTNMAFLSSLIFYNVFLQQRKPKKSLNLGMIVFTPHMVKAFIFWHD